MTYRLGVRVEWLVINTFTHHRRRSLIHLTADDGATVCGTPVPAHAHPATEPGIELECMRCTKRRWLDIYPEEG